MDPMIPLACTPAAVAAAARVLDQERRETHHALVDPQEAVMMVEVHAIHPTNQLPPLLVSDKNHTYLINVEYDIQENDYYNI